MGWFTEDRAQKRERVERFQQEARGTYKQHHPQQWRGSPTTHRAPPSPPPTPSWEHHAPVSPPASSPDATRARASTPDSARARVASPPTLRPAPSHPVVPDGWDHGVALTSESSRRPSLERQLAFRDGDRKRDVREPARGDATALPPSRAMLASIAALGLDRPRDPRPLTAPAREHAAGASDAFMTVADVHSWRASLTEDDARAVERHRASTSRLLRDAEDARATAKRIEAVNAKAAEWERAREDPAATAAAAAAFAAAYSEYERASGDFEPGSRSARAPPRHPGFDPTTSAFAKSVLLETAEASSYAYVPAPTGVSPAVPAAHAGIGTVRFTAPAQPQPEAPPNATENDAEVERARGSGGARFDAGPDLRARMAIY